MQRYLNFKENSFCANLLKYNADITKSSQVPAIFVLRPAQLAKFRSLFKQNRPVAEATGRIIRIVYPEKPDAPLFIPPNGFQNIRNDWRWCFSIVQPFLGRRR